MCKALFRCYAAQKIPSKSNEFSQSFLAELAGTLAIVTLLMGLCLVGWVSLVGGSLWWLSFFPILKEVEAERWAVWEDGRAEG